MAQRIVVRDPDIGSWPLILPEEVVIQALLPRVDAATRKALRLTCRVLRIALDASITYVRHNDATALFDSLPSFVNALPRLQGLREVAVFAKYGGAVTRFLKKALPKLTQLKSLALSQSDAPLSGRDLAPALRRLQQLEVFDAVCNWSATRGVARALARMPALRELRLTCEDGCPTLTGELIQWQCDELGADAWRSLEVLEIIHWPLESAKALAQAPLTRLTCLHLEGIVCKPGDRLGSILSGAAWAPQLRELEISVDPMYGSFQQRHLGLLSDLRLPNLTSLSLTPFWRQELPVSFTGWSLPRLQSFSLDFHSMGPQTAASLAALTLPALTELEFVGFLGPDTAAAITALFNCGSPWLPQLHSLTLYDDVFDIRGTAWQALAAAPLTALRQLTLYETNLTPDGASVLGGAPWLRGLTKLCIFGLSDANAAALRAGSGGFAELEAAGRVER